MRPPAVFGYATFLVCLLAGGPAAGQGLSARGDADCSVALTAADVVASVLAFAEESVCDNDDCDRDGELTPADIDCAARCLFGECPISEHAPEVTAIEPETAEAIAPFTTISVRVSNLDPESLIRVTIGDLLAEVVEVIPPDEIVVLVPPLPPGPAPVRVQVGELAGLESVVDIAAQVPVGDTDDFEGTLDLLEQVLALFAQLDLGEAFGEDAEAVLEAIQIYRDELAAQRLAFADDPNFTAELEATLDAGMDSAGVPDQLRELIADIQALLASEEIGTLDGQTSGTLVGAATIARRVAKTLAVARGVIAAGGTVVATGASIPTGLIAVGTGAVAGVLTLAGSAALPPIIVETVFTDRAGQRTSSIHSDGTILIRGRRLVDTQLVIRTALGEEVFPATEVGDNLRQFQLGGRFGFCGIIRFYLKRQFLAGRSEIISWGVEPQLVSFFPESVDVGKELILVVQAAAGCPTTVRYTRATEMFPFAISTARARQSNEVDTRVPNIPSGRYTVDLYVDGVISNGAPNLLVSNPIIGVQVTCTLLEINMSPGRPNVTSCTAKALPASTQLPIGSRFVWTSSDPNTAGVEGGGPEVQVAGTHPGTTVISADVKVGDDVIAATTAPVTITVKDVSVPGGILRQSSAGPVTAGTSVGFTVSANDNEVVTRIALRATGDAVLNPAQELPCFGSGTDCDLDFTVNLKEEGEFSSRTFTVVADVFDGSGNQATTNELALTIEADGEPPTLMINSPANGSTANAGSTVQVVASATDNVGVKVFNYTATGDALVSAVSQRLEFPNALPAPELRFNFTIKPANELIEVANRTIVVTVTALDETGNVAGPQSVSVSVIGVLDNCQGSITASLPAGYIGDPTTITVTISGDVAAEITRVTSINPGGSFDLAPRGNGVYDVTLFYQGTGRFNLSFTAFDGNGVSRCSGSINLESLGPKP